MLSEEDLKNQYISRNIKEIIQNIQNNNYDYCFCNAYQKCGH